ncbi:MAG: hypothetical protein ACRDRB_11945 [Pseudonocardiaceae bacterium]
MRIADIFSSGCGRGGRDGYGGDEGRYHHEDYSWSRHHGSRDGDHYDRHDGDGILGILGGH